MSGPLRLTGEDMVQAGYVLKALSKALSHEIVLDSHADLHLVFLNGDTLAVRYDSTTGQYVIDDRCGS